MRLGTKKLNLFLLRLRILKLEKVGEETDSILSNWLMKMKKEKQSEY